MMGKITCLLYGHEWWPVPGRTMQEILGSGLLRCGYITQLKCKSCGTFKDVVTWTEEPDVPLPDNVVWMKKK